MGTVRRRGSKYQGIVRVTGHDPIYRTFDSAREAKRWVSDQELLIESKVVTNPEVLITDVIDQYVKEIAPKRKMAESHLGHDIPSIKVRFAGMKMKDLQGRGLTDWLLKQEGAPSTRAWHIARLFGVLRQAETHWNMPVPWQDMKTCRDKMWELGWIGPANERDRRVSDAELAAIKLHIKKGTRIKAREVFDFCLFSAMRIGEVCRITWDDLDKESRTILIRDRKHPRKKFGNHQTVPLLNGSFEVLESMPKREARIFPYHPGVCSKVFHDAATKAGLENVVLHDLRHEAISRMFELGFAIQEVAMVSGHRDWKLLRRYTHLRPASLVEKERRLRGL